MPKRTADEIRSWQLGIDHKAPLLKRRIKGQLLFPKPPQPSSMPNRFYARCPAEQRVIVETEIAAQLCELNETFSRMLGLLEKLTEKRVTRER